MNEPMIKHSAFLKNFPYLLWEVDEMMGDQMMLAYSTMGMSCALYGVMSVSLLLLQCVHVSSFIRLYVFLGIL